MEENKMKKRNAYLRKAVFIDKDGTLIPNIPYNIDPNRITIDNETIEGLRLLKEEDFLLVVISNQAGIAKGYFEEKDLEKVWSKISGLLQKHRLNIDAFYYCPHEPNGIITEYAVECNCRKPLPGMLLKAASELRIDLCQSWMVGDILNDVEAGNRAGCFTILIDNGNETEWRVNEFRTPAFIAKNILHAAAHIKMEITKTIQYEQLDGL
jgi:D-glycero-D-manno-heptose 1,7-bisphosphate phosphatase